MVTLTETTDGRVLVKEHDPGVILKFSGPDASRFTQVEIPAQGEVVNFELTIDWLRKEGALPPSFKAKFDAVLAEVEAFEQDDFPEDILEQVEAEQMQERRAFLEEQKSEELRNFDWWEEGEEIAKDELRERLLAERLTPEEKDEREMAIRQASFDYWQNELNAALKAVEENQRAIETATQLGKPKMLKHYTDLKRTREDAVTSARNRLATPFAKP